MNNFCLSKMIQVSNNSMLTHQVAKSILTRMSEKEVRDFAEWIKLVSNKVETGNSWEQKAKRGW
jgi:hypothetical protein